MASKKALVVNAATGLPEVLQNGDYLELLNVVAKIQSADLSDVSGNYVDVTDMSFPIGANENWIFEFTGFMVATGGNNGGRFSIVTPAGATLVTAVSGNTNAVTGWTGSAILASGGGSGTMCSAASTDFQFRLSGTVRNGATAGTVKLQAKSQSAGVVTFKIYAGTKLLANKAN